MHGNYIKGLKDKLKMLKEDLRVWKKEVFGYNERLRLTLVNKLQVLDQMDDDNNLDENLIKEHK